MTAFVVRFKFSNMQSETLTGYNCTGLYNPANVGTVVANALDSTGLASGLSLAVTTQGTLTVGNSANADADIWGIPVAAWRSGWCLASSSPARNGAVTIGGFLPGQTGTLTIAGHANNARNTNYVVNGGAGVFYDGVVKPPTTPVIIPFTADGSGNVVVSTTFNDSYSYMNFIIVNYEVDIPPSITGISNFVTGQTASLTLNVTDFDATSVAITDSTVIKNVALTPIGSGQFTFPVPAWVDGATGLLFGNVGVTVTNGSVNSNTYTGNLLPATNHAVVTLTSVSGFNYGQQTNFNPPLKVNSQIYFTVTDGKVSLDGIWDDDGTGFLGITALWDRDPEDFITRVNMLTVNSALRVIDLTSFIANSTSPLFDGQYIAGNRP